ncbi:MAG: hypothetical protein C4521_09635 [Actinobacteria bacterium]|nr:MAG: hypothetical protein C4521_09635 [Actinomycetota bacterium]
MREATATWVAAAWRAGALVLGLLAGGLAIALDVKIVAALALGTVFVVALRRVWLEPKLGLYLAVVAFSLDSLGKLPLTDQFPITLYQITIAVTLAGALRDHVSGVRSLRWKATRLDLPILFFVVLAVLVAGLAPNLRLSLVTLASLLSSVVLFYLILVMIDTPEEARRLLLWLLGVATVLAVLAITERMTGVSIAGNVTKSYTAGIRIRGSFKDPNIFGMLLMTALVSSFALVLGEKGLTRRRMAQAMAVVFVALVLTFSRGAWLAFAAGAAAIVLAYPGDRMRRIVPLGMAFAVAALLVLNLTPPEFVQTKILRLSQDTSTLARIYMLKSGVQMVAANPIGAGLAAFPTAYAAYRYGSVKPELIQSHTAYLTIAVEMGLAGLGLFLLLLFRFLSTTWPDIRSGGRNLSTRLELAATAAVLGILVQAWFYSVELSKQLWFCMGLAVAAQLAASRKEAND